MADGTAKTNQPARPYHHRDLRAALLAAATEIISDEGLDAFTLRAVARRVGVSAMAPAHHFGNGPGLLTEIATRGFIDLGDELAAVPAEPGGRARLIRLGHAYVDFALRRPGIFRLMWRKEMFNMDDAAHVAAGRRAFDLLDRAVRPAGRQSTRRDDPVFAPSVASWSLVHGFAMLALDGAFARQGEQASELDALLDATLDHLVVE